MKRGRRPQAKKENDAKRALRRGVVPFRRMVAPESTGVFEEVLEELRHDMGGAARIFELDSLSVTVVGLSRFNRSLLTQGPPSKDIKSRLESANNSIEAKLGALGLYGSQVKPKLAFELHSPELSGEIEAVEELYSKKGFTLQPDPNCNADQGYKPHCTIGMLYNEQAAAYFRERSILDSYNLRVPAIGQKIILAPIELPLS